MSSFKTLLVTAALMSLAACSSNTVQGVKQDAHVVKDKAIEVKDVVVDKAFLGYVVGDSDMQVWIGNSATAITTMNNSVLASMGFSEVNTTDLTGARWADLNAGGVTGNVIMMWWS